jgi:hypothetical protein
MAAQPIPEGYQTVSPDLGMIGHAELGIRDSRALLQTSSGSSPCRRTKSCSA